MVDSLTKEKVEFIFEKDEFKKRRDHFEKNSEMLSSKLESAKKVIDERDQKLDALKKKLESLEATNEVNVRFVNLLNLLWRIRLFQIGFLTFIFRQLDRCQLDNDQLITKIDKLDKNLKKVTSGSVKIIG